MNVLHAEHALVVGGGTMAAGIAACLGAAGVTTVVQLRRPEAVEPTGAEIDRRVGQLVKLGIVTGAPDVDVRVVAGRPDGRFTLAIESIAEDVAAKRAVLAKAEALLDDDGILATNTSSLRLGDLDADLARPERFVGWHWFNPAELVPLVEVVGGATTAEATLARLVALSQLIGKRPIAVRRDVPGFVANRLQYALLREAYALVDSGVCDVDAVDTAVTGGLGARWAAIGPFASMDAAGLDVHEAVARQLFPVLSGATELPELLRAARARGETGVKGGRGLCGRYPPGAGRSLGDRRDAMLAMLTRYAKDDG